MNTTSINGKKIYVNKHWNVLKAMWTIELVSILFEELGGNIKGRIVLSL
jgi:hypothetical protein